uniref:AP2/ERF domain-containing protein n=1 Tax=Marseillevirus LCMAC101 TaxID=2506602 RepID=A0A481YSD6_9VIRU|nr:MAG: uncharacterized protein LCMAC101_02500 [Marseillevirus LCMAC101]
MTLKVTNILYSSELYKMTIIVFIGDWEGGGKVGRRHLRRYRKIKEVPGDEYIEVELNDGYIMKCDVDNLDLVQKYRWSVSQTKGRLFVRATMRKTDVISTFSFPKMMLSTDQQISHINKDNLDNRRSNLKILGQTYREDLDYVVEDIDKSAVSLSLDSLSQTGWMGGIPGGSLNECKAKYFMVRFLSPYLSKCFSYEACGGKEKASEKASDFRRKEAERRGLIRNKYRIHNNGKGSFIEVQCNGDQTFFCDVKDLDLVESRVWSIKKRSKTDVYEVNCSNRAKTNLISTSFHQELGLYKVVDHIDGNPLNNRRCNLREGNKLNNRNANKRKDNSSGVTGVSFNDGRWKVQWPEDGKRRSKSFRVNDKVSSEEAKKMAIEFRLEKDKELNLHQQRHL